MQINVHNADKRVGRGANLINALIGCISRKWQMTYNVIWVGGHVWRSILSFYGASLLNKFTEKQLTTVTLQLIVTQAFQGKHTALTSIKIQLLTEINYIWSTSLWRRDPINLVSLTAFARAKKSLRLNRLWDIPSVHVGCQHLFCFLKCLCSVYSNEIYTAS